ncbi:MAG: LVIVD repeat-containing protein [Gammaproteobacteria bacterium]
MRTFDDVALECNVRRVGHLDLPGGGQIVVDRGHAYVGHMKPPHGTSIIDVTNPIRPKLVSTLMLEGDASHTHKVRVVGDVMYTNVEQNNRHFLRKGDSLPALRVQLERRLGHEPAAGDLAAELGVKARDIPVLDDARERGYDDGGFKIYDIADRAKPRLIRYERTFGFGAHRFDVDENHAYISTEMAGFLGNILVNYDVRDPACPIEVSRWWLPGQHVAGGERPTWQGYSNRLHHAMRAGNELWAAVWHGGFRVLDVSDISSPKVIGAHDYHPPFPEPTHTVMPVEVALGGRRIAVGVDEEHVHRHGRLHAFMWIFDVSDLGDIKPLSVFDLSERDSPWSRTPGARFGAHQYREKLDSNLIYVTWFSGGLRVVDIGDPGEPVEVGHFIPEPVNGVPAPQSNDVDVDENGLIYLLDRNRGLDVLELTH